MRNEHSLGMDIIIIEFCTCKAFCLDLKSESGSKNHCMHHFLYYHMDQMQEYYHFTLRYALLIVYHPIHQLSATSIHWGWTSACHKLTSSYQWIIEFFNEQWMWPHSNLQLDQPAIIASVEGGKVHATVKQTLLESVIVFIMRSKNYVWNNRIIFTHVHVFSPWRAAMLLLVWRQTGSNFS